MINIYISGWLTPHIIVKEVKPMSNYELIMIILTIILIIETVRNNKK